MSPAGVCTIKFDAIEYPDKHAWLILSSRKLSKNEQNLRYYIWEGTGAPANMVLKSKINPATNDYEVKLTNQIIHSAYIYIDFPRPVNDGGYYYSIDLWRYCGL